MHQVKTLTVKLLAIAKYFFLHCMNVGQLPSCKLEIIRGGPEGSVIQPFTGWRGNVALVAQAGPGCKITDKYLLVT